MSKIQVVESNLQDCEKAVQYYKYHRDRKIKKFEKKVTGLYLQDKIYVNFNTFVDFHFQGTPSEKYVLKLIKKMQYKAKKPLVRIDSRLLSSMTAKGYSRSTIQQALKNLDEKGFIFRFNQDDFPDLKEHFELPLGEPCRLLRCTIPDYVQVKNDKSLSLERNAKSIIGAEYGVKPQDVEMKHIWDFSLNNHHLKNLQRGEAVRFFAGHICFVILHNSFNKLNIKSSYSDKQSLNYFPFKKNERIIQEKDMLKTELRSSSTSEIDTFLSLKKFTRHGVKNSFGCVKDRNMTYKLGYDQIIKDFPEDLTFKSYDEVVRFMHEDILLKRVPLAHVWVMVLCAGYASMFANLIEHGDAFQLYQSCWERVMFSDKELSKVIGMKDYRIEYIENKLRNGGRFGTLPDCEQLPLGSILHEGSQDIDSNCLEGERVGKVQKKKSARLARMDDFEKTSLEGVTTRRERASVERSEKRLRELRKSDEPTKKKIEIEAQSKARTLVRNFTRTFDWDTGGDPNLTEKGIFMRYLLAIQDEAKHGKWHKSWKWHVVKDYYNTQMKKRLGAGFVSDVIPKEKGDKKFIQTIGNVKGTIERFNFVEYMEMLYFCIHNPDPLYFYNFFNQDFRLFKLSNYERMEKIKGIMNKNEYWADKYLHFEDYDTIVNSEEAVKEDREQAEMRLSAKERVELATLEKEVNSSNQSVLEMNSELYELDERRMVVEGFISSYEKNLRYLQDEKRAEDLSISNYSKLKINFKSVSDAQRELSEICDKIQAIEDKMDNMGNIEAKRTRIKELLGE